MIRVVGYAIRVLQVRALCIRFVRLKQGFFSEFLIHAADVEGLCQGIDEELVSSKARSLNSEHLLICLLKSWVNGLKYLRLMQEAPKV